jgi:transposase
LFFGLFLVFWPALIAVGVKAGRRPPGGRGLDTDENAAIITARKSDDSAALVGSLRDLIDMLGTGIVGFDLVIAQVLAGHPGYRAIQRISGIGPMFASIFVAEIGDPTRFATADKLTSWAGLTPRHRESDTTVHRGRITKQGNALVRWAAVEAVQRTCEPIITTHRARVADRRGRPGRGSCRNVAKVAAARVLLKLV